MQRNIGFISTRFAGTDGVSLEANKWAAVFEELGHQCFWFAGELDREPRKCRLVPEAHFQNTKNKCINRQIYGQRRRDAGLTDLIHALRCHLKNELQKFIEVFKIDLVVVENALALPMNLPLGIALAELISETQIPTIAHHHDFYWERNRYHINAVGEYLQMAFPPNLPNIEHVVINSGAKDELSRRRSITATCIPNVFDFDNPPVFHHHAPGVFRKAFGLKKNDVAILQPTRIVQRKGIEHAVKLVKGLGDSRYKLLISHESGDEGYEYAERIKDYALENGVDLRIAENRISAPFNHKINGINQFCLWSIYAHADFITFPSLYEGFGNAILEAIYFKKPLLVNRYPAFVTDIEPRGFDLVTIDGFLTKDAVQNVKDILYSEVRREKMIESNYQVARRYFSYSVLRNRLGAVLTKLFPDTLVPFCTRGATGSRYAERINKDLPIAGVM
jgi:glycosyltransferase involved in cell wall biosynthesis